MQEKYNINKTLLNKRDYQKTINTQFTELVPPPPEVVVEPTVDDFFQLYDTLFFDIPKNGDTNSHEYLVKRSGEYIGEQALSDEFLALVEEVTDLRQQLLDARREIAELTVSGSNINVDINV